MRVSASAVRFVERAREHAAHDVDEGEKAGEEGRGVAVVTMTTCVASQKFESSTARIISSVSPLEREMVGDDQRGRTPITPAATLPMAFLKKRSRSGTAPTAPQPMKSAEE
jgi:hypothetical protein